MDIKYVHIGFIIVSTLLSVAVAVWGFLEYRDHGETSALAVGIAALVAVPLLVVYARRFFKKLKNLGVGP